MDIEQLIDEPSAGRSFTIEQAVASLSPRLSSSAPRIRGACVRGST